MGLLNPAGLAFSVFIAALFLLYFWERSRQRYDVPSLMFWEAVPEAVVQRRRFQPDPLFWLQLAALSLLVLALANPYRSGDTAAGSAATVVIVLDQSASMQAREDGGSRFEMARAAALRIVEDAPAGTNFAIIGAGRTASLAEGFAGGSAAAGLLRGLEPVDLGAAIEPGLLLARQVAARAPAAVETHVFTDLPADAVDERLRAGMNWWPFGTSDDNLAIVDLQLATAAVAPASGAGVHVTVRNFANRERHGSLTVSVGDRVAGVELFTAGPGSQHAFFFANVGGAGIVEARLNDDDALAVDNRRYGWIPPPRQLQVAIKTRDGDFLAALERIGKAAGFALLPIEGDRSHRTDADLAIFHRSVPRRLPDRPTLLIAPESSFDSPSPVDEVAGATVVDWQPEHPALRGIDPVSLPRFASMRALPAPAWGETVITALAERRELPLVIAGRHGQQPLAIIAGDLATDGVLTTEQEPALLLLVNLIAWLTRAQAQTPVHATGQAVELAGFDTAVAVVDPAGARVDLSPPALPLLRLDRAGRYEIIGGDGDSQWLLANFTDSDESDIGRAASEPLRVAAPTQRDAATPGTTGRDLLLLLTAVLLSIEWHRASRRNADG